MHNPLLPIRRLSEFTWRSLELYARSITQANPQIQSDMAEAIANYQGNGFCFFQPFGDQETALGQDIKTAINACDETVMSTESKAENYRFAAAFGDAAFLKEFNQYIRFTEFDNSALDAVSRFLQYHQALLTAMLGYSFNVLNVRCQISEPGATVPPFNWHTDELPDSVVKILYYIDGASAQSGSTAIRLDSGEELVLTGEPGSWLLVNINRLLHKGVPSQGQSRKMLEITLGPSLSTDCKVHAVALNASCPWVPWLSPSYREHHRALASLMDAHTTHFNKLVNELNSKGESSETQAMAILKFNAEHPPRCLNVGGGPGFLHKGWRNFEEIFSAKNPVPFHLSPGIAFPLAADSLDIVYTSHNLEHLDDDTVAHVLSEAYRVLEKNGFLIIKIPDFDRYLALWRQGDTSLTFEQSPFSFKESRTWRNRDISDNITYRTAEMFCGVWDTVFGDEKALFSDTGDWQGPGYVGPPWIAEEDISKVFTEYSSCHDIAAYLKARALDLGEKIYLNHQNAWSQEEMSALLTDIGYRVVSTDAKNIVANGQHIPGIEQWFSASAYYLAQKV